MDCQYCDAVHVLGPYALVVFFSWLLYTLVKRYQEHITQLHGRTLDVFERQQAIYERVHFDLVAIKKSDAKDAPASEAVDPTHKKR